MRTAILAEELDVIRDTSPVLRGMSFKIPAGTITGLIGPSGSGKTTLMRAIVGAQRIAHGKLTVLGEPAGSAGSRPYIGYVTQSPAVYDDLTTHQNLHYFARILRVSEQSVREAITMVDLDEQRDQIVGTMSGGQRTRVSLAVALLADPPLLVLDEPTVGLDPVLRRSLWQLFSRLADKGRTLLVSSHVMSEAAQCQNILLLRNGRVLYNGTKERLLHSTHTKTVENAFLYLADGGLADSDES